MNPSLTLPSGEGKYKSFLLGEDLVRAGEIKGKMR